MLCLCSATASMCSRCATMWADRAMTANIKSQFAGGIIPYIRPTGVVKSRKTGALGTHCKTYPSKCLFSFLFVCLFVGLAIFSLFFNSGFLYWANTRHYLSLQSFGERTVKSHERQSVLDRLLWLPPALLYNSRRSETLIRGQA